MEKAACGGNILSHLSENYGLFFFVSNLDLRERKQDDFVEICFDYFALFTLPEVDEVGEK